MRSSLCIAADRAKAGLEVKALEGFLEQEARHRDAHLMVLVGFRVDLTGQQLVEEVGVGKFLFRRLLQARGKFGA
jgi:hypothetical protein